MGVVLCVQKMQTYFAAMLSKFICKLLWFGVWLVKGIFCVFVEVSNVFCNVTFGL